MTPPFTKEIQHLLAIEMPQKHRETLSPILLEQLMSSCKFAFDQDFNDFGSQQIPGFSIMQLYNKAIKTSDTLLKEYTKHFVEQQGAARFLKKYPGVKDLIQLQIQQFDNFRQEILDHLASDQVELAKMFNKNKPLSPIKEIRINQGDKHKEGKSTAIIEFVDGFTLVYKPRAGALDKAVNHFLESLSSEIGEIFKTPLVLDRSHYFWMEHIDHLSLSSRESAKDYYYRCGILLGLCYLLKGTDFHFENIIAHGDYPVLIDTECLFSVTTALEATHYSVYNTGLVPLNFFEGQHPDPIDGSGFGAFGTQVSGTEIWKWVSLNTDALRLEKIRGHYHANRNQPKYKEEAISPKNHLDSILAGFTKIVNWFFDNKTTFDLPGSPFSFFKEVPIRLILRSTNTYKNLMENSCIGEALQTETSREEEIRSMLKTYPPQIYLSEKDRITIVQKELETIQKMNVPLFTANTMERHLYESDQLVIEDFYPTSPYDFVVQSIKALQQEDIKHQVRLIQSAFATRYQQANSSLRSISTPPPATLAHFDNQAIQQEVDQIAQTIVSAAIQQNKRFKWTGFLAREHGQLGLSTLDDSFYTGSLGIVGFLAAFVKCTNDSSLKKSASAIIKSVLTSVTADYLSPKKNQKELSFSIGLAGLIYVLLKTHPDKERTGQLVALAEEIKLTDIATDQKLDIMGGAAGLLLVLSKLYKRVPSQKLLEKLIFIGDHILNASTFHTENNSRSWTTELFSYPISGFSHGAAGMAYALLVLFKITGIEKYKTAFYQALNFENQHFDQSQGNWCDLRASSPKPKVAWCHGATGIGLMRLHAYGLLKAPNLLEDIQLAIAAVKKADFVADDCYCCGTIGRIDFLLEAAKVLQRSDLLDSAKTMILQYLNNKNAKGFYTTYNNQFISQESPSLFRGTSGIGYVLLKSLYPDQLSCFGLLD